MDTLASRTSANGSGRNTVTATRTTVSGGKGSRAMSDDHSALPEERERLADRSEKLRRLIEKGIIVFPEQLDAQAEEFFDDEEEATDE
jgi:hypothetical protein